jgi:puromycin-sensitive aminopeptidase
MVVDATLTAFSNMPEKQTTLLPNGTKRIEFMDSPKMSTYLLAFCVGEFDFVQTITNHGVVIRVYTPPGKAKQGLFSLDCAKKSLDYFDDFFDIPYPLPKLDMVAVPEFAMVCSNLFFIF